MTPPSTPKQAEDKPSETIKQSETKGDSAAPSTAKAKKKKKKSSASASPTKSEEKKDDEKKSLGNSLSSFLGTTSESKRRIRPLGGGSRSGLDSTGGSRSPGLDSVPSQRSLDLFDLFEQDDDEDEIQNCIKDDLGRPQTPTFGSGTQLSDMNAERARKMRQSVRLSKRFDAMNSSKRSAKNLMGSGSSFGSSTRLSMMGSGTRLTAARTSSTRSSVSRKGSDRFTMLKDLEERDEFQKIQAGAFLRELYKLAEAHTKQQLKETVLAAMDASNSSANSRGSKKEGTINFEGMEVSSLTPTQAKQKYQALHAGEKFDSKSLISLVQAGVAILSEEDTVIDLRQLHPTLKKVTAIGDLHGSLECLMVVLKMIDIDNIGDDSVIVFDGDFVDRGYNSLEVIVTLLLLKLSHPKNVFLLRGNHEDSMTATSYGFREEVDEKYGYDEGDEIWWEFGMLFAAFPIVARSNTAAIMHGGIPVEEFELDDLNDLAKETRCEMKTVSDPYDDDERLLQGILWSDPSEELGINFSDRGAGFTFGPDISADFLDRHNLKYLIRAHEVVEAGHCQHDVGDGRGVVTIFSSANYPAGEGTNHGAVLFLDDETGDYYAEDFIHKEDSDSQETLVLKSFLGSLVDGHKSQLTRAFRLKQNDKGHITCEEWADTISEMLDLPEIEASLTWLDMQPELAPATEPDGDYIDWTAFLNKYTTVPTAQLLAKDELSALSGNKERLLDIYQLMDINMDGGISKEEFSEGIELLNQQIKDEKQRIKDPGQLFHAIDIDNDGELTIEEVCKALQESSELQGLTDAVGEEKFGHLKHNLDMIAISFKYLDANKNGVICKEEFQKGFDTLNERMPDRNKFGKHQEWFDMFDLNETGDIDFNSFKQLFCAV